MKRHRIRAVISDLGGVLVSVDKMKMSRRLAKHSSLSAEQIAGNFSSTMLTEIDLAFGKGIVSPFRFYHDTVLKLKLSGLDFARFVKIYCDIFHPKKDMLRLLQQLHRGYALALLSNTDELHFRKWSAMLGSNLQLFKQLVLSFKVHIAKPDEQIFLKAAELLGVNPEQCIYIDDIAEYVDSARGVGMRGIQYRSTGQVRKELRKLGVAW